MTTPSTLNSLALGAPPRAPNITPSTAFAPPPQTSPQQGADGWFGCCGCERQRAQWVLSWPDARFLLCSGCLPPSCVAVAEPVAGFDAETLAEMATAAPSGSHLLPVQHDPVLVGCHRSPGAEW